MPDDWQGTVVPTEEVFGRGKGYQEVTETEK
jgi:hypothetical protein